MKKILITGAQGFIGSVLSKKLSKKYDVLGTDIGYFKKCKLTKFKDPIKIINCDIRQVNKKILKNVYAVVHLAALSNDPLGNFNKNLTHSINVVGTNHLAKLAKAQGVKKFLFMSSCIMYGASKDKIVNENSPLKPLTEYAKSKVKAEKILFKLANKNFKTIVLRNGTIYGFSPRMRFDTVLNNFIAQAFSTNKIVLFGNGKPFRPVVHVDDVCSIIDKFIALEDKKTKSEAYNIGNESLNFQMINLAKIVKSSNTELSIEVLNKDDADYRTYVASFKKISKLFPKFKFNNNALRTAKEILSLFKKNKLKKNIYFNKKFTRISYLKKYYPELIKLS